MKLKKVVSFVLILGSVMFSGEVAFAKRSYIKASYGFAVQCESNFDCQRFGNSICTKNGSSEIKTCSQSGGIGVLIVRAQE